jgi:heme-degrading monooxygenase HmoA
VIEIVWEFEVAAQHRERFLERYSPDGDWARLFARHDGYRGTTLVRSLAREGLYIVTDRWRDVAAFEAFRFEHGADYDALDAECEALTLAERPLGRFAVVEAAAPRRPHLRLRLLPGELAVVRLKPGTALPAWGRTGPLASVVWTADETSIVCDAAAVPGEELAERGFRAFALLGPIPFTSTGVLASLTEPLARAGISLFALSTYDTDYVLVKEAVRAAAEDALRTAGHQFVDGP